MKDTMISKIAYITLPILDVFLPPLEGIEVCAAGNQFSLSVENIDWNILFFEEKVIQTEDKEVLSGISRIVSRQDFIEWTENSGKSKELKQYYKQLNHTEKVNGIDLFRFINNKTAELQGYEYIIVGISNKTQIVALECLMQSLSNNFRILIYSKLNLSSFQFNCPVCHDVVSIFEIILKKNLPSIELQHDYTKAQDFTKYYIRAGVWPVRLTSFCFYGRCKFCPRREIKAGRSKFKSIKRLISEIQIINATFHVCKVRFIDDCVPLKLLIKFAQEIINQRIEIKWYSCVRFESYLMDDNVCKLLAQSGCVGLFLGLETASDPYLELMNKGIDAQSSGIILQNLFRNHIKAHVSFLYGFPGGKPEDYASTESFILDHLEEIDCVDLNIYCDPKTEKRTISDQELMYWFRIKGRLSQLDKLSTAWNFIKLWETEDEISGNQQLY